VKPIAEMSRGELAAYIQSHLRARNIEAVLTGGSVVSIYSGDKYVSKDIDLVISQYVKRSKINDAMLEIGFQQIGRHFGHPEAEFLVEFPGGPLSVGKQQVTEIDTLEYATGTLKILSPTDCVKDRLAAYYYWDDHQSLAQAIMVLKEYHIDLAEVANWSQGEGKIAAFKKIERELREASI